MTLIPTPTVILDRYNSDPSQRRRETVAELAHEWRGLKRGDTIEASMVINGFWRGKGGVYASYGPRVGEVTGWKLCTAEQAKQPFTSI